MSIKDCGFAPLMSPYDEEGKKLLESRPKTKLIKKKGILDIQAFIDELVTINEKVGDIIIFSHGNDTAWMKIDLDHKTKNKDGTDAKRTTYYVVNDVVKKNTKTVEIPVSLHQKPPDPPTEFDVHIRGCSIGKAPAFVTRLKEAFKTPRFVTAPKHAHYVARWPAKGIYEHLAYVFELFRPDAKKLPSRAEAVKAFDEGWVYYDNQSVGKFTFIDSGFGEDPVPKAVWERTKGKKMLIPDDLKNSSLSHIVKLGFNIGENIGPTKTELELFDEFEHKDPEDPIKIRSPLCTYSQPIKHVDQNPGNDTDRLERFSKEIRNHEDFIKSSENLFPIYEIAGYKKVDDFLNGYTWKCDWNPTTEIMTCTGKRHIYAVYIPVVETRGGGSTGELFFNIYPLNGSTLVTRRNLPEDDPRLFFRVP